MIDLLALYLIFSKNVNTTIVIIIIMFSIIMKFQFNDEIFQCYRYILDLVITVYTIHLLNKTNESKILWTRDFK